MSAVRVASDASIKSDFDRAGRELRHAALSMAQAWQVLQRTGWSSAQLRPLALALRQFSKGCDRLKVHALKRHAVLLEHQLMPYGGTEIPGAQQIKAIEAAVSALTSSALAIDLSAALPDFVRGEQLADAQTSQQNKTQTVALSLVDTARRAPRLVDPNAVIVLRADKNLGTGLIESLKERGHRILELTSTQALEEMLAKMLPGGLVLDARFLNGLSRQLHQLKPREGTSERPVAVAVLSDRRDLGRKLLALRHGARGYFEEPIDAIAVCAALGLSEAQRKPTAAAHSTYRALLCTLNVAFAKDCTDWLTPLGVATRHESNGIGALAACVEYAPHLLLVDATLPQPEGLRLLSELRRQLRNATLPAILFAGTNSLQQREQAIAAGADEYLIEPVRQKHLLSVVSSRLERFKRQVITTQVNASAAGLMSRAELLADFENVQDCALMFIAIDQRDALIASHPISVFSKLDEAIASMLRPRLRVKDSLAYFQDGEYLLGLQGIGQALLEELAEKIRASVMHNKLDLGTAIEALTVSVCWQKRSAGQNVEVLAHRVRHATRVLANESPNQARAAERVLLANPGSDMQDDLPEQILLQPILPTTGKVQGQYLMNFAWRDGLGQSLDYAAAIARASASGHGLAFDQRMLVVALNRRADELKRGRQVRLLVEIGEHSAANVELASWLTNELVQRKLSGSGLSLFINVSHARQLNRERKKAWNTRAHELHALGMRLGLHGFSMTDDELAEIPDLGFDFAILPPRPKQLDERWGKLLKRIRERGAVSIVSDVMSKPEIDQLRSLRVDFALSHALAPPGLHTDFDFAGFARV
jgi:DNA-binding response OmpR family regulator